MRAEVLVIEKGWAALDKHYFVMLAQVLIRFMCSGENGHALIDALLARR